jgi:hypothetical protein
MLSFSESRLAPRLRYASEHSRKLLRLLEVRWLLKSLVRCYYWRRDYAAPPSLLRLHMTNHCNLRCNQCGPKRRVSPSPDRASAAGVLARRGRRPVQYRCHLPTTRGCPVGVRGAVTLPDDTRWLTESDQARLLGTGKDRREATAQSCGNGSFPSCLSTFVSAAALYLKFVLAPRFG